MAAGDNSGSFWPASLCSRCRASGSMSSRRSRSGGTLISKLLTRYIRSARNSPSAMAVSLSRLVAAIKRTSTSTFFTPPTRKNVRVSSARSSFDWSCIGISMISSKNSVPPSAISKSPNFLALAPENAPASWPNSSLSSSVSCKAAQFRSIKGLSPRLLKRWIACAISSLPTPDSPVIRTDVSDGATRWTSRRASFICGESATISGKVWWVRAICARKRWLSTFSCCFSAAAITRADNSPMRYGFVR